MASTSDNVAVEQQQQQQPKAAANLDVKQLYETSLRPQSYQKRSKAMKDKIAPQIQQLAQTKNETQLVQLLNVIFEQSADYIWDRKSQNDISTSLSAAAAAASLETVDFILNYLIEKSQSANTNQAIGLHVKALICMLKSKLKKWKLRKEERPDAKTEQLTANAISALLAHLYKLFEAQFQCNFDEFIGSYQVVYRVFSGVFAKKNVKVLLPLYLKLVAESSQHTVKFMGLALLSSFLSVCPTASVENLKSVEDNKQLAIKIFNDFCFEYSSVQTHKIRVRRTERSYAAAFAPFYELVIGNDAATQDAIYGMLSKCIKRGKENIAPIFVTFIETLAHKQGLLSESIVTATLPLLEDLLYAKDEVERKLGAKLVAALSRHHAALDSMLQEMHKLLQNGSIGTAEKSSLLQSLTQLHSLQPTSADAASAVPSALVTLLSACITSQHESEVVKGCACDVLATILSGNASLKFANADDEKKIAKAIEEAAFAAIIKQESTRLSALRALTAAVKCESKIFTADIIEKVCQLITKSEQKVVDRTLAVYALNAVLVAAQANKPLYTEFVNKKKLLIPKLTSYLVNLETVEQRCKSTDDYLVMFQLIENTIANFLNVLGLHAKKAQSELDALHQGLIACAVNVVLHAHDKSTIAFVTERLQAFSATRSDALIAQFYSYLNNAEKYKLGDSNDEQIKRRVENLRSKAITTVFLAIVPLIKDLVIEDKEQEEAKIKDIVCQLVFIGHHPLVRSVEQHMFNQYMAESGLVGKAKISEYAPGIAAAIAEKLLADNEEHYISAYATLAHTFAAVRHHHHQTNAAIEATQQQTLDVLTEKEQQDRVIPAIFNELAKQIQDCLDRLWQYDEVDFEVFAFEKSDEQKTYHDSSRELTNNPMFRQGKSTSEFGKYSLTDDEWKSIFSREDDVKKKNRGMDTEAVRKLLISETMEEKEDNTRNEMLSIQNQAILLLKALSNFVSESTKPVKRVLHRHLSLCIVSLAHCMELEMSEEFSNQTYLTFRTLCTGLCSPDPFPFALMDAVARLTVRVKQSVGLMDTQIISTRGRDFESDDDVVFSEHVISKLKLTMQRNVDAESFSVLLPLFQTLLHRNVLRVKGMVKGTKLSIDSLRMAMMILSQHAGLEHIRAGVIRPVVCKILVEALAAFPQLNKQAHSALQSLAHYLIPADLDPLLDGLLAEQGNVRFSVIKTLEHYTPFHTRKQNVEEVDSEEISHVDMSMYKPENPRLLTSLWAAKFDVDSPDNANLASRLWTIYMKRTLKDRPKSEWLEEITEQMYTHIADNDAYIRSVGAAALFGALQIMDKPNIDKLVERLIQIYEDAGDIKNVKLGVATAFTNCCSLFTDKKQIETIFKFLTETALRDEQVQDDFVQVGLQLVKAHGSTKQEVFLNIFRDYLSKKQGKKPAPTNVQRPGIVPQAAAQKGPNKGGNNARPNSAAPVQQQEAPVDPATKKIDDYVTGTVVVFMGNLAAFFAVKEQEKILDAITKLIETLKIPSAAVQKSVSDSLVSLISKFREVEKSKQQTIVKPVIEDLIANIVSKDLTYGERKGMAFGLAGIVAGLGIGSLKQFGILSTLKAVFKKNNAHLLEDMSLAAVAGTPAAREGVLIAIEILAKRVKTFEPYISEVLPQMLDGFSDVTSAQVRDAAQDAASAMMSAMSGHGVRMILPSILQAVKPLSSAADGDWRVKVASIQLLGAMAYCSSRQLSEFLPVVSTALCDAVLNDTHKDVQGASMKALERVGGVIQNPEISPLVPAILKALTHPDSSDMDRVMDDLLYTRFLHSIDAPSLALLLPILYRGLKERLMEVKKKAAQIVGSISALVTNPHDLLPYITELVPLLQNCIIDPHPSVRQSSAKAVGTLAKSIGEARISNMMDWLHQNLEKGKESTVERSGAAQTMSEIIAAQGPQRLSQIMPELLEKISGTEAAQTFVKHGYLQVFIYLPALMKGKFEPFLTDCLPRILECLSDNEELVRDTAMNSSKVIIELYATSAVSMLVPALEHGLQSGEYRVRLNTLVLLLDFFRKISSEHSDEAIARKAAEEAERAAAELAAENGEKSDDEDDDDDEGENKEGEKKDSMLEAIWERPTIHLEVLYKIISQPIVERLLALVFMLTNDSHIQVRTRANDLWKQTVFHTPKMLRQILKILIQFVVARLAAEDEDLREDAAKTLGELLMKVGERVIGEVIPILIDGLSSDNVETRFGVCLGLKQLLYDAHEKHISSHQKKLLAFVKKAVCDVESKVQESAAEIFDLLFKSIGAKIVNELLNQLFTDLMKQGDEQKVAIAGLQELVKVRGTQLLSKLMPKLIGETDKPMDLTVENSKILAAIAEVAGSSLSHYVERLSNIVIKQYGNMILAKQEQTELFGAIAQVMRNTAVTIPDEDLEILTNVLKEMLMSNKPEIRMGACQIVLNFFEGKQSEISAASKDESNAGGSKRDDDDDDDEDYDDEENLDDFKDKFIPFVLENLLRLFADQIPQVVERAHKACMALCGPKASILTNDELPQYMNVARDTIRQLSEDDQGRKIVQEIAGFNIPQGLDPLLSMYLQGLMSGVNVELREQAALGLGDLIELTSTKALTPYVVKMTGPLIRIVGDRFPWQVKAAILKTMTLLLVKSGATMRPFLPQLQTTFIKSLQDANAEVRSLAANALGKLVVLAGNRVDGLLNELNTSMKQMLQKKQQIHSDPQLQGVVVALLQAVGSILLQPAVVATLKQDQTVIPLYTTISQLMQTFTAAPFTFDSAGIELRSACAHKIAIAASCLQDSNKFQTEFIDQEVLKLNADGNSLEGDDRILHGRYLTAASLLQVCPQKFLTSATKDTLVKVIKFILATKTNVQSSVRQAAMQAAANILLMPAELAEQCGVADDKTKKELINAIEIALTSTDNTVRYDTVKIMKVIAKKIAETHECLYPWVKLLLYCSTKDRYIPVKLASERTLIYVLNLHNKDQELLKKYAVQYLQQEPEDQKLLKEYVTRVLKKLESEELSDEE